MFHRFMKDNHKNKIMGMIGNNMIWPFLMILLPVFLK